MNSWRNDLKEISDKMEALSKENARLRDAKTLIGQTIIEYHGTEEWCKKNRSITGQKEGCRWCNLAKKALEVE